MTPELRAALEGLRDVDRLLVALDFDGTISLIVPVPSDARPLPGALELLGRLQSRPGTDVALVSGRARDDLATVSGAAEVAMLIGSHGQEAGAEMSLSEGEAAVLRGVRSDVAAAVDSIPGVRVEMKPAGLAVHVRGASEADGQAATSLVRDIASRTPGAFSIDGKLVIEISVRPLDKGSALRTLIEADPGRRVLFAGDDVTDESAMAVLRPEDIAIRVGPGPSVATFRVPGPPEMVEVLALLAEIREQSRSPAQDD
jgi:trehalose 6-phosphate phosphatase